VSSFVIIIFFKKKTKVTKPNDQDCGFDVLNNKAHVNPICHHSNIKKKTSS